MNNIQAGIRGEDIALGLLLSKGMTLVERNFRAARCEIDLIMRDGEYLVFVEVKARTTHAMGSGAEAVDARKQAHIIRAAERYLFLRGETESPVRFDVVDVRLDSAQAEHIADAFRP